MPTRLLFNGSIPVVSVSRQMCFSFIRLDTNSIISSSESSILYTCLVASKVFTSISTSSLKNSVFSKLSLSNDANKSPCIGAVEAAAGFESIFKTRFKRVLNSNSSNILLISSSFLSLIESSVSFISYGTSIFMVARYLERIICSLFSSTFFLRAPFSLSVFSNRLSMLPNSVSSFSAVLGPTPGHPGMLSDESPISPNKSIICSGWLSENFSITSLSFITSNPLLPNFGL